MERQMQNTTSLADVAWKTSDSSEQQQDVAFASALSLALGV